MDRTAPFLGKEDPRDQVKKYPFFEKAVSAGAIRCEKQNALSGRPRQGPSRPTYSRGDNHGETNIRNCNRLVKLILDGFWGPQRNRSAESPLR